MTPHERRKPEIIKASRKRRIAAGAGTTVQEVNPRLLKQFEQSRKNDEDDEKRRHGQNDARFQKP